MPDTPPYALLVLANNNGLKRLPVSHAPQVLAMHGAQLEEEEPPAAAAPEAPAEEAAPAPGPAAAVGAGAAEPEIEVDCGDGVCDDASVLFRE